MEEGEKRKERERKRKGKNSNHHRLIVGKFLLVKQRNEDAIK